MEYKNILIDKSGGVVTITLNRPDRLNALSVALRTELETALEELEKEDDIKVAIITGASRKDGRPCFSAGADIKEMAGMGQTVTAAALGTPEQALFKSIQAFGESRDMLQFTFNKIEAFSKPTIAAVDGLCTAGGLEIALACDIRIVAETAQLSDLHMKNLKILGGGGMQTRLTRNVGASKAKQMIWTGNPISGKEAWRIGLADEVYPPETMMQEARKLAGQIAQMDLFALRASKHVINASLSQGVNESLRYSAVLEALMRYMRPGYIQAFENFGKK